MSSEAEVLGIGEGVIDDTARRWVAVGKTHVEARDAARSRDVDSLFITVRSVWCRKSSEERHVT